MAEGKYISYLRVSTARQGVSGLGLGAQRAAVAGFLNGGSWSLVHEFVEIESGKGEQNRPKLAEAMSMCRLHGATLVVAKLDRLSRNAAFLVNLQNNAVKFVAADMPFANELTIGLLAIIAQHERKMISERTTVALREKAKWYAGLSVDQRSELQAKNKATQLGGDRGNLPSIRAAGTASSIKVRKTRARTRAADLAPVIEHLRAGGASSLREIAAGLNARGIPTAWGGTWSAVQVQRVLG